MNLVGTALPILVATLLCSCNPGDTSSVTPTGQPTSQPVTLYSVASMDGPITWASPDTYTGSATATSASIGDDATDTNVVRCVVSFDLSTIPDGSHIDSAQLRLYQNSDSTGDSYPDSPNGLGAVYVDNIAYAAFAPDANLFGQDVVGTGANIGALAASFAANTWHELEVTTVAQDEMTQFHSRKLQFRIYHHYQNDNDSVADTDGWVMGDSPTNRPELVVGYR